MKLSMKRKAIALMLVMFAVVAAYAGHHDERYVREEAARINMKLLTVTQAEEIAAKSFDSGNVRIKEVELEDEADDYPNDIYFRPVYQIEVVNNGIEYDLDIDAVTGEVLKLRRDN